MTIKMKNTDNGKEIVVETEIKDNRVYFKNTTFFYDLIPGDTTGIETIKAKLNKSTKIEIIG